MGDNRDDSLDSRFSPREGGIGFVPVENLIGRATLIFWSTDGSAEYAKPWTWFSALRGGPDRDGLQRNRTVSELRAFLRQTLGHEPNDLSLFERALTHSSVGKDSYERLEFLGDRVLGLVIARWLYERFEKEPEGKLSRRYNVLVSRETCAEIGRELGLAGANQPRQAGSRGWREPERQCRRRRGRGAGGRTTARRRARHGRRVHPACLGTLCRIAGKGAQASEIRASGVSGGAELGGARI